MNYRVILEPQPDGGYTVYVPSLPGCISEGDDRRQALNNIREAIALYRESLADRNLATPSIEEREVIV
jgi:predicted RNase H-like HicB family nuclease